jgi:hypothetical protein
MPLYTDLVQAGVRARIPGQLLSPRPIHLHCKTSQDALPALLVLLASRVVEESVKLLEGLVLCLRDEEEGSDTSDSGKGGEEDKCTPADAFKHGRDDETDDKVEEPVETLVI